MKTKLFLYMMICSAFPLVAQERSVLIQPFVSDGFFASRVNGANTDLLTAGVAVIAPVSKKFFVRPLVAAGRSFAIDPPKPTPSVSVFQVGALVGYRVVKRFSALTGFQETVQFPKSGTLYLPTFVVSTATRFHGRWGILTPFSVNARSYGICAQLAYTR